MNGWALLGLILILYSGAVVFITLKKPENVWVLFELGRNILV